MFMTFIATEAAFIYTIANSSQRQNGKQRKAQFDLYILPTIPTWNGIEIERKMKRTREHENSQGKQ